MAKRMIDDIVITKKEIRRPSDVVKKISVRAEQTVEESASSVHTSEQAFLFKKRLKHDNEVFVEDKRAGAHRSQLILWTICIASVATLLFFLSMLFATATVTITPKSQPIVLNTSYQINKDPTLPGLHYETMSVVEHGTKTLDTNGTQQVAKQAIGTAIIYNNYSSASQRLINNTRLAASDGHIYRIRNSVTVPGMTTVSGVKTPGSVSVEIIADQPGDSYNMKVSDFKGDFTIPGFTGTAQYTGFYGRLSADLAGGFVGTVKTVDPVVLAAGRTAVESSLKDELIKSLYAQKPAGDTLFGNDYFITFADAQDNAQPDSYTITENATATAIVFHTDELAAFIAKNNVPNLDASTTVDIIWNSNAAVNLTGSTIQPWTENSLSAHFSGNARVVWQYNGSAILNKIKGQDKSILQSILDQNKDAIAAIAGSIRPQWKNSFPTNVKKITLVDTVRDVVAQ